LAKTRTRPSGRRPPAKKRRSTAATRTQRPSQTAKALSPHKGDIQGVALVLIAVLLALGVWFHNGGKVGGFLELFLRGLFGYGAYAVPVLVAGLGVAMFRRTVAPAGDPVTVRVTIGLLAVLLGGLGLIHLARGNPPASTRADAMDALHGSGGWVGAAIAHPTARLLSVWGARTAFACLLFLGLLISTRTSVAAVGRGVGRIVWLARVALTPAPAGGSAEGQASGAPGAAATPATPATPAAAKGRAGGPALVPSPTKGGRTDSAADLDDLGGDVEEETARRRSRRRRGDGTAADDLDAETVAVTLPSAAKPSPTPASPPNAGEAVQLAMTLKAEAGGAYTLPPGSLLRRSNARPVDARRLDETAQVLQNVLEQFEVDARVVRYTRGPTVTRYEVELGPATKVARVVGLSHDIAYAVASPDVRIIAPIPGKSAIGIEIPNRDRELVTLGDILGPIGTKDDLHPLTVALGKDIGGEPVLANLTDMPHVLIAGATGAGKSVCLNVFVTSLLMRNPPERVRVILIDPKRVEMTNYEGVPHLITPVVTHPKRASEALAWAVREMELRLETLALVGVRNIAAYNKAAKEGKLPKLPSAGVDDDWRPDGERDRSTLPYVVVVIDELSDLMMVAPRDVEDAICRIAQMARAVGIHLVVATQRPSVDVVTGLIKANIPSRIAFMVASAQDSRVILDAGGADKLVGHGDMLYLPGGTSKARRVQGAFITEKEVEAVVAYCKAQQQAAYQPGVVAEGRAASDDGDSDEDPLLGQAMEIIVRSGLGSTSMLQSRMKVGFSRARRIMDQLEDKGVVGPSEGSKPRDVLMTVEELEELRERESTYDDIVEES
jgi:DNA segregation ATPase FtsK/SpoIIIE, S-DNA-T family